MGKVQQTEGPYWSKAWIQKMWEFTNQNFVDFDSGAVDFEALGREEYDFRKAMFFRNFKNSKRAEEAFNEAKEVYESHVKSGKRGGRPKSATDASRGNSDDDCKAPPSVGYLVADGETREGSQNLTNTGNGAHLESRTSATTSFGSARPARGAAAKRPLRNRGPTSKEEFRQFVYEQDLNISLAEDWYAMHEARDWTDNEGGPLKNWKGALTNYCRSRENQ